MKKKQLMFTLIALIFVLALSACTRTASTPIPKSAGDETEVEFPVLTEIGPTQPPLEVFGTQTAQAAINETTVEPPAVVETATPIISEGQAATAAPTEAPASVAVATQNEQPAPASTSSEPSFPVFEGYGPGFPTFGIRGVVRDATVTIQANDFPAGQTYVVTMGPMYTGAINGTVVDNKETGEGGSYLETYNIPASLQGSDRIAIRIEFSGGRYAVNWFYNTTTY